MTDLQRVIEVKGWTLKEVWELWGIKQRQMNNITRNPKPIHFWAVKGLPDRTKQ